AALADASHWPSGLKATPQTTLSWPLRTPAPAGCPVLTSQILTVRSKEAVARCVPSGLNTTPCTRSSPCPFKENLTRPVVASQRVTLPFAPVEASHCPSGLNFTFRTPPNWTRACPPVHSASFRVVRCQTLTVPSVPATAIRSPSGLYATSQHMRRLRPQSMRSTSLPSCVSPISPILSQL